ncbi:MAG: aldo/keto reductase [Devosiaceae bacterium]|nr:aldo/keto reductase [Devosiaceae bacterium MH13]
MPARTFTLRDGFVVNRLGYGAMRLTGQPGNFGPYADWDQGIRLLRRALELGINHIDSARAYGPLDNERLIGEALAGQTSGVLVASKGGLEKTMGPSGMQVARAGSSVALRRHVDESRKALGDAPIGLCYLHFPDPEVPFAESVEALAAAKQAGLVERVGLSNVSIAQIEEAEAIVPITAVQNRFSMASDELEAGREMVSFCAERGIAFVPHGPLGANPTKQGAKLPIADAMAWLLELSANVLLIPGTTSIAHLEENVALFETLVSDAA